MSVLYRTIGPPGCGKTTWLARQCLNASQKYSGESIAIASLTRTAAAEVASRSTGVPRQNIGTLHSHAFRQLKLTKEQVAETTQGVKAWNEACGNPGWTLTRRSVANPETASADEYGSSSESGDQILAEISVLRARCVDSRFWPNRIRAFWKAWTAWKSEGGRLDFTDMIEQAYEKVDELPVDILMLDEAQDMSLLEMRLARKWGEQTKQMLIVGDPDQTIYEWRGSDPAAFYEGEASLSQVLAQSYRVPRTVHKLAVEWIEQIAGREKVEYYPRDEDGRVVVHHNLHWRDPRSLGKFAESLTADGSTVAVLASCAYMLAPLAMSLKQDAVAFHNPYRPERWEWNPMNTDRLLAFLVKEMEGRNWTWEEMWKWVQPLMAKDTLVRGAKSWFEGKTKAVRSRGPVKWEDDNVVQDLVPVLEMFLPGNKHSVFDCDIDWWEDHLLADHRRRQRYVLDIARRKGYAALRQRPLLALGTIHSFKGGEADKVVLLPDISSAGADQWGGRGRDAVIRQFYVGMTRARSELHIAGSAGQQFVPLKG